jgi:MYXO-CTERM domain-containing protein
MIIDAGLKAAQQGNYPAPAWTAPEVAGADEATADSCEGDTCTETDATDPANASAPKRTVTTSGCSAAPGTTSGGSALFAGLAMAAVFAARRNRARRAS